MTGKTVSNTNIEERVCKIAYTLNNEQPVVCTIISDTPLFYIDCEEEFEDDSLFDDFDMDFIEQELSVIKDKSASLDRLSLEMLDSTHDRYENFADNKESIRDAFNALQEGYDIDVEDIISKSRLGSAYLDYCKENNIVLEMSSEVEDVTFDECAKTILINQNLDTPDMILATVRELRRAWYLKQGILVNPLVFGPDNAVLFNRMIAADLAMNVIRVAWELQLAGVQYPWKRIENSPLNDLGRVFAREAFVDFRSINSGDAATAVFESWFLSDRCKTTDKKIIQKMLSDYQEKIFNHNTMDKPMNASVIAALGEMPFGNNYLSKHASIILDDPIFNEIRDRSNANFLWFIKFERTFQETEHELQGKLEENVSLSTADVRHAIIETQTKDYSRGHTDEISLNSFDTDISEYNIKNIVALSDVRDGQSQSRISGEQCTSDPSGKRGADIIYLRRRSAD